MRSSLRRQEEWGKLPRRGGGSHGTTLRRGSARAPGLEGRQREGVRRRGRLGVELVLSRAEGDARARVLRPTAEVVVPRLEAYLRNV